MSPALLWQGGQPASDLLSGSLAADQAGCRPNANRVNVLYTRGGRTETNLTVSSWLDAASQRRGPGDLPQPPWKYGVIDVLPSIDLAQQETVNAKVPEALVNLKSSEQTAFSFAARFGLVDTTWARDHSVTLASIQNEANSWVQPSTAGALETLTTSTIGADNIVDIDELNKNPLAYPLVTVNYAVAPTTITEDFTATDAEAVRRALGLIVSTEGQQMAATEGFVPLTADLTARAVDSIAKIGSIDPAAPTTTAAPTTAAPTTAADRRRRGRPTRLAPMTRTNRHRRPLGGPRAPREAQPPPPPPLPRAPARIHPVARRRRPRRAPAKHGDDGTDAGAGSGQPVAAADSEDELPQDIFDSLFGAAPLAPDLPVVGAAGATIAVAGQGLNLWRVSRKRPPTRTVTPSPSRPTDPSSADSWTLIQAVGEDVDRCVERLADPAAEWSEADAERVDSLVMVIDDLRSRVHPSPSAPAEHGDLAALYESPVPSNGAAAALDVLAQRASLAQEQAWQRAGRPIPMYRAPKPILAKHFVIEPVDVGQRRRAARG